MSDDDRDRQRERFRDALDRKGEDAERRSRERREQTEHSSAVEDDQESLYEASRPQETVSPREKGTGKGKKTADKWNQ